MIGLNYHSQIILVCLKIEYGFKVGHLLNGFNRQRMLGI